MKQITKFAELEKAFLTKNPNGSIKKASGGVHVSYSATGNTYKYKGTYGEVAEKLKLSIETEERAYRGTQELTVVQRVTFLLFDDNSHKEVETEGTINENKIYFNFDRLYGLQTYQSKQGIYFNFYGKRIYIA